MARLVESVVADYGEAVRWEKVVTKELAGAQRFMALTASLGKPVPVPSIFIDGELVFSATPSGERLKAVIDAMLAGQGHPGLLDE